MPDTIADAPTTKCPHCKKQFAPSVDMAQLPRLQGAKCPHCKLFVPSRSLVLGTPATAPTIPAGAARRTRR